MTKRVRFPIVPQVIAIGMSLLALHAMGSSFDARSHFLERLWFF
jgi:hypothetical protein